MNQVFNESPTDDACIFHLYRGNQSTVSTSGYIGRANESHQKMHQNNIDAHPEATDKSIDGMRIARFKVRNIATAGAQINKTS